MPPQRMVRHVRESNVLFARRKEPLLVNSRVTGRVLGNARWGEFSEHRRICKETVYFGVNTLLLAQHAVEKNGNGVYGVERLRTCRVTHCAALAIGLTATDRPLFSMQLFRKQITSPGVDAVLMALVGWSLLDLAAVPVHPVFDKACVAVGVLCFVIAWLSWRRSRTTEND